MHKFIVALIALFLVTGVFAQGDKAPAAKAKTEKHTKVKAKGVVDKDMKGPNGEIVYTGPKGGKYYLDEKGKKKYLKKAEKSAEKKKK